MNVLNNIEQLIGNTPLYEVVNIEKKFDLKARLFVKLEYFNPAGSVKDRTALFMLNDAEKKGLIKENATIIEPTFYRLSPRVCSGTVSSAFRDGFFVFITK